MTPELQRNKRQRSECSAPNPCSSPHKQFTTEIQTSHSKGTRIQLLRHEACYTILELQAFAQNIEWNWFIWEKRAELNQKEQIYGLIPVTCSSKHKWKQRLRKTLQIRHAPVFSLEVQTKGLLLSFHQESIFKTTATILFPSAVTWLLIFKKGN